MRLEESILLKGAKKGDIDSFERLIESVKGKAFQVAISYMKNQQDAEDVLQLSLLKIYRNLDHFKEESSFYTWVFRIVINTCMDELKKSEKHIKNSVNLTSLQGVEEEGWILELPDESFAPEHLVERAEKREMIRQCLGQLPENARQVIILRDIQGLSYEEIGDILECSEGTIKSRINRARQKLKALILKTMEQTENHFV